MMIRWESGLFERTSPDWDWSAKASRCPLPVRGGGGWQSRGGPSPKHPARLFESSLELLFRGEEPIRKVYLVGIFALWAGAEHEKAGQQGGALEFYHGQRLVYQIKLLNGKHYLDALQTAPVRQMNGDGTSLDTFDTLIKERRSYRIDVLSIDLPRPMQLSLLRLRSEDTPSSFVIFDVVFELEGEPVCPFKGQNGKVALSEIGMILRLGDRPRFQKALGQLEQGILVLENDLDEARSLALTFLAVVSATMLEMGAPRSVHRLQLEAARELDRLEDAAAIAKKALELIQELSLSHLPAEPGTGDGLMDKAMAMIERNFALELTDDQMAEQLGLSSSHFRFRFRQATGHPFHQYVIAMRLEKARQLLVRESATVGEVARAVGFSSPAHFTRAFTKRFLVAPSTIRLARKG